MLSRLANQQGFSDLYEAIEDMLAEREADRIEAGLVEAIPFDDLMESMRSKYP